MPSNSDPRPIARVSARKYCGLGDIAHAVAAPVARMIDRIAGTEIEHCAGCARRRDALNRVFPLRREPVDKADGA